MNSKYILLAVGIALLGVGIIKPNLNNNPFKPNPSPQIVVDIDKPVDPLLLANAQKVADILKKHNADDADCYRLASLYRDLAQLVSLDGEWQVVRNTEEIRQANRLSGVMLRMNINDKYPDLAISLNNVLVGSLGDDDVSLNSDLRTKAVDAFMALSWACVEGTK